MKQLYLLLLSTFVIGFLTGVFVYFMSGLDAPTPPSGGAQTDEGLSVIADAYGGCMMLGSCPSYNVNDNGSYAYLAPTTIRGENTRYEGTLSRGQMRDLRALVSEDTLLELEESVFSGTCPIAVDGVAYSFSIMWEDEIYNLDTCEQALVGEPLIDMLISYFELFSLTHEPR